MSNLKFKAMTTIDKLKVGDLFTLVGQKRVRVYDGYNRSTKKYSFTAYDDISSFSERKKGTPVNTDF